jgi:homoserine dehydrogenase
VPLSLLHTRAESLACLKPSLVIDELPGVEPSYSLIKRYLSVGVDVVSANKAVIAASGWELSKIAAQFGAHLH